MARYLALVSLFFATALGQVGPQDFQAGQLEGMPYRLFVPKSYDSGSKYPLVVFLHGAGERGTDNVSQLTGQTCSMKFAEPASQAEHPAFVLAPQCPPSSSWSDRTQTEKVLFIIERIKRAYNVDPGRIYLTGISMGGYGTWSLIADFPTLFAAAIPICGGGDTSRAAVMMDIPIWIFHGGSDPIVPVTESRNMYAALQMVGATDVHYTEFPGVGHNSWDAAYATVGLSAWIFSKRTPSNQLSSLTAEQFSSEAVRLSASSYAGGALARDAFSAWGVKLSTSGQTVAWFKAGASSSIVNGSTAGQDAGSAHQPLVIELDKPAAAVGLSLLGNPSGGAEIVARIRAFGSAGADLGFAEKRLTAGAAVFVGIAGPAGAGISRIMVDYGSASKGEELAYLLVQFLNRPAFSLCLAQLADGPTGPDSALKTELQITSLSDRDGTVVTRFRDENGNPLAVPLAGGGAAAALSSDLSGGQSIRIVTAGSAQQVVTGYITLESDVPIEATAIYRLARPSDGTTISETSLRADEARFLAAAPIDLSADGALASAIALANTSDAPAKITVRLQPAPDAAWISRDLTVEPHRRVAQFVGEMFPEVHGPVAGAAQFSSDQPVCVLVVRTLGGLPLSNVAVGSTER